MEIGLGWVGHCLIQSDPAARTMMGKMMGVDQYPPENV